MIPMFTTVVVVPAINGKAPQIPALVAPSKEILKNSFLKYENNPRNKKHLHLRNSYIYIYRAINLSLSNINPLKKNFKTVQ